MAQTLSCQFEGLRGSVLGLAGVPPQDFAAGDVVVRGDPQPGGEMLVTGPMAHIQANG